MYRIGVIGGRRGQSLAQAFAAMPDCQISAICDVNSVALEQFNQHYPQAKAYQDYKEMLNSGLDIVVVASPVPLHHEHTIAALESGAHVLQEVILGYSIKECQDIVAAVKAHPKQKFMLAENCCYWAQIMSWRKMFKDGLLGQFLYAEAEYIHNIPFLLRDAAGKPTWRASMPPIYYCTHSLGPLLYITGEKCISVCGAHTASVLNPDLGHIDMEVAIIQTASHGVIKILAGFGVVREPAFHYYSLYGSKGNLETSRPPQKLHTTSYLEAIPHLHTSMSLPLNYDVPGAPLAAQTGGHGTAEYYMVQDYLDCVRFDRQSPVDIGAALAMSLPGLCAHESASQGGKPVAIPELL